MRRGRRQHTECLDQGPRPRQGPQASQGLVTVSYQGVRRHQRHFLPKLTLQRTNWGTMGSPWARLPLGSAPQPVWDSWRTNLKGLGRQRPEQVGPGRLGPGRSSQARTPRRPKASTPWSLTSRCQEQVDVRSGGCQTSCSLRGTPRHARRPLYRSPQMNDPDYSRGNTRRTPKREVVCYF